MFEFWLLISIIMIFGGLLLKWPIIIFLFMWLLKSFNT
jgi:hypothetical protein